MWWCRVSTLLAVSRVFVFFILLLVLAADACCRCVYKLTLSLCLWRGKKTINSITQYSRTDSNTRLVPTRYFSYITGFLQSHLPVPYPRTSSSGVGVAPAYVNSGSNNASSTVLPPVRILLLQGMDQDNTTNMAAYAADHVTGSLTRGLATLPGT